MILLGVDPHKFTHTATAVEPESNLQVGSVRIEASLTDHRRLLTWAKRWPQRKWAVENSNGLGRSRPVAHRPRRERRRYPCRSDQPSA